LEGANPGLVMTFDIARKLPQVTGPIGKLFNGTVLTAETISE
jgi:hypothetical protein